MQGIILRFLHDECAATAIEYALIAGGIAAVIVAAVNVIGNTLNTTFGNVASALN